MGVTFKNQKLALYVICIRNISCETFLFKSSYLSRSLPAENYGSLRWNKYRIITKANKIKKQKQGGYKCGVCGENMKQFTTHVKNGSALVLA